MTGKLRTTLVLVLFLLSGCSSIGLSSEDKSKVVGAALEPGVTAWCLKLPAIEPACLYKQKETK